MILLNGKLVEQKQFPNGELFLGQELFGMVTQSKEEDQVITWRFESNDEMLVLHFINCWLKEEGYANRVLVVPYLPYSRMDRKVNHHLFSLKYLADWLNGLGLKKVWVLEAHSDATMELIHNCENISYTGALVAQAMEEMKFDLVKDVVVFPDAGAVNRYKMLLDDEVRVWRGVKKRDFDTGDIVALEIVGDGAAVRNVLIVDDLCSRGGTFLQIEEALSAYQVNEVSLAVMHLEANVYSGNIFEKLKKIYTTNAMEAFLEKAKTHKQITVFELPNEFKMTLGGK